MSIPESGIQRSVRSNQLRIAYSDSVGELYTTSSQTVQARRVIVGTKVARVSSFYISHLRIVIALHLRIALLS